MLLPGVDQESERTEWLLAGGRPTNDDLASRRPIAPAVSSGDGWNPANVQMRLTPTRPSRQGPIYCALLRRQFISPPARIASICFATRSCRVDTAPPHS